MIDIGVNLTSSQFREDWRAVNERAQAAGVNTMLITGTSVDDSVQAQALAQQLGCYSTAGVHPHNASQWQPDSNTALQALLQQPHVVAVGECGLDYDRNFSTPEAQRYAFQQQLEIAVDVGKPLFLHCREAHDDFLRMLKPLWPSLHGGVLHCFTGSDKALEECLELGLYIGITGWLCDERRGQLLQQQVRRIPLSRLLLETDAPYLLPRDLSPKPKSRRNEPMYLPHIARRVAELTGTAFNELVAQTSENARRLFHIPASSVQANML